MKTHTSTQSVYLVVSALALSIFCAGHIQAQASSNAGDKPAYAHDRSNIQDALDKVRSGHFALIHVAMLANANRTDAMPDLEAQFQATKDIQLKTGIASALVKLRDPNSVYWDYLQAQAGAAIQSDAPAVVVSSSDGQHNVSPAFLDWAKAHNLSQNAAIEQVLYLMPSSVLALAEADDPRAVPLLEEGLKSNNFVIQKDAALGLASLHETDAVPLIISACDSASPQIAATLAESLVYFDDPSSAKAVSKYVPADKAATLIAARRQGRQPFNRETH